MSGFFHTFLYNPIYNLLVFLVGVIPGGDVGLAVVIVTLLVKIILLPVSLAAVRTQRVMKEMEPKLKEVRERFKGDREKQAKETLALYKEHHIHPFASIGTILIQIPVLIGLYWVFQSEALPTIDVSILYPFVAAPENVSLLFLGFLDIAGKSIVLAALAGFFQLACRPLEITVVDRHKETMPVRRDQLIQSIFNSPIHFVTSLGLIIPFSVMIPVIYSAGVTSNAGLSAFEPGEQTNTCSILPCLVRPV